jgi:AAA ATPase-like protein
LSSIACQQRVVLAASGWWCDVDPESGMCHRWTPRLLPIFRGRARTAAISLRPVTRDNPGEMGGRVASPTFVGRIEELQGLEAARERVADGKPAVVLVGGEAGVGKTRLVAELTARCANDGTRVLAGGCVPVGDGALPYAPIVEMLRVLIADLGANAVRELVGPSWPDLAPLLPALGEPETGPAGPAAQARLFELLLGLLGCLDWLGGVGGPFGDRGHRAGPAQHRGRGHGQDGDQRVAAAAGGPRVGDRGQGGEQIRGLGLLEGLAWASWASADRIGNDGSAGTGDRCGLRLW